MNEAKKYSVIGGLAGVVTLAILDFTIVGNGLDMDTIRTFGASSILAAYTLGSAVGGAASTYREQARIRESGQGIGTYSRSDVPFILGNSTLSLLGSYATYANKFGL
ncbi:MAG: hypothetical protein QF824_05825 [Candidatus Woesearchaeota archaeon]|jgi:hypothetical protein|nr:hypothetical protein [Candidatus Woesearchaeota archaeon]